MTWKRSTLLLVFEDPDFEGLEVRTKRFAIDDVLLLDAFNADPTNERLEQVAEMLAATILSWNFVDENDVPVEISPKSFRTHVDGSFFTHIIRAIRKASVKVPDPLALPSDSGDPALEASLPMETLP